MVRTLTPLRSRSNLILFVTLLLLQSGRSELVAESSKGDYMYPNIQVLAHNETKRGCPYNSFPRTIFLLVYNHRHDHLPRFFFLFFSFFLLFFFLLFSSLLSSRISVKIDKELYTISDYTFKNIL